MDEASELAAVHAFLRRYETDRQQGAARTAPDYAAMWPEHAAAIEREYAALQQAEAGVAEELRIGPYAVVRELGRGGQAVVYLARDERLQREVALKVLPRNRTSLEQELRLRREAMTAARLEDSGICPVYDVGHDGSHAFLAMRYVPGRTLGACIEAARAADTPGPALPLPQLLELFERLCQSLHRAHEAGVVHRDLKPGNIMLGDDGVPVLLDFGLAVDVETDGPLLTRSGDVFGTPAYLPPERLLGHGRGGDRRWDVWAVGVSLYEACTLQRPFAAPTLDGLYRAILNDDPTPVRRLVAALPVDLGHVLAVCLDKVPERRYQTAADLAYDLRAVRLREPIRARPPSVWRRVQRWHRRYAALATALWVTLFGLLALAAVQRSMLDDVRSARDEAQSLNEFLVEKLLLAATPNEARGRELTAAEVFERAAANVASAFPEPTPVAGMLQHVLGRAFQQLGRRQESATAFERAVRIRSSVLGATHRETLRSRRELTIAQQDRDQIAGIEASLREILALQSAALGGDDEDTLVTRRELSRHLLTLGRPAEAEIEARAVVAGLERTLGPEAPRTLGARHWVGRTLVAQGRRAEAEPIFRQVLALRRRVLPADSVEIGQSLTDLATLLHDRASYEHLPAKWDEAEVVYLEDQALALRIYPKTHPSFATSTNNLASFWADRFAQAQEPARKAEYAQRAEQMFRESLALREATDGPDSIRVATVCVNLASLLSPLGRHEEALALLDRALSIRERVLGRNHLETVKVLNNRAIATNNWRGPAAGVPLAQEALARARANPEFDPVLRNIIEYACVAMLSQADRHEEALVAAEAFHPRAVAQWGANSGQARSTAKSAARALRALGRPDEAAAWEAKGTPAAR
jgi:serine/threonine-protein kinase